MAAVLLLATLFVMPLAAGWMAAELPETTQAHAVRMTRMISPIAGMMVLIAVLSCRLMARERHTNTLLEGLPGLAICIAVLSSAASVQGDDVIVGLLVGTTAQLGLLMLIIGNKAEPLGLKIGLSAETWRIVFQAAGVLVLGQLLMSLIAPIEHFFAARIGEGAVANLGYANRLLTLINGLGAVAISRAILPVLSSIHADDAAHAKQVTLRWTSIMVVLGLVTTVIAWVLAPFAVAILFERGAFAQEDSAIVTSAFRWGAVQFPFYFGGMVVVQLLIATARLRAITLIAFGSIVVKLFGTYWLSGLLGVSGITLATGTMYLFSGMCLLIAAQKITRPRYGSHARKT